jgi:hypothetical protein
MPGANFSPVIMSYPQNVFKTSEPQKMKKLILPAALIITLFCMLSCAKGITTYEAANGKAKCGRYIR